MAEKEINGEMPSSTTSAEVISDNHDLLSELLIRLPAKSLIRFKSVSKHWRTLISDASFSKRHTLRHRCPQTSFLLRASPSQFFHFNATSKTFAPFNFKFPQINVRQSCNGLLLLECRYPEKVYYVFNPTTGESRNLFLPKREYLLGLFLAFDPSKSFNYKVVCLRFTKYSCNLYEISVYDSETHEWRHNEHAYSDMPPPFRDWVYSNNCIYALAYHGSIFCFDIEKLKFRKQPLEDFGIRRQSVELKIFYLLETYGRVHRIAHDNRMSYLVIHEIAETNGDWSVRHLNAFDCITAWFDVVTPSKISFLGLIRGDRKEQSLVFHVPGMLLRYHFCRRAFDDLRDLSSQSFYEEGRLQFGYHDAYQFVESLAPV